MQEFKEYVELNEAAYAGNIGIMELIKFKQKANDKEKKEFDDHLKNKRHKDAWETVQRVTGVKLHKSVSESLEKFFSKENPPPMHIVAYNYHHLTKNGQYTEKDVISHFNKKFGMKMKKGDIENHIRKQLHHPFSEEKKSPHPDILPVAGAGQWGTDKLANKYKKDTPGQ